MCKDDNNDSNKGQQNGNRNDGYQRCPWVICPPDIRLSEHGLPLQEAGDWENDIFHGDI